MIIAIIAFVANPKYFAIIAKYNRNYHIQLEVIIVFRKKLKTPFRISPSDELYKKKNNSLLEVEPCGNFKHFTDVS
jgi:hypothetical protein